MKGIGRQSDRANRRRQQMAQVMAALEAQLVARQQILPQSPPVAVAPGDPRPRPASPPAMEAGGADQGAAGKRR